MNTPALLDVAGVDVHIGPQQILSGVDLTVGAGELVAVTGPNGAGKTTLLRTIAGLQRASGGTIRMHGAEISAMPAIERARRGVTFVPAARAIFPTMTVWDNLLVGCHRVAWDHGVVTERIGRAVALFPRLGERFDQRAGSLSGGEQQMLALAKGLLLDPALLLVDELALGLAPAVVADLLAVLRERRDLGTGIVVVEQSAAVAGGLADRVVTMDRGTIVSQRITPR